MNAGPDVERLIAEWLVEEAPVRAPDRILDSAAHTIDRTRQRRFAVAWREPMTLSIGRLVAALAIVILVVGGGAAWLGRSTAGNDRSAPTQAPASAPPTSSPTVHGPTLGSYRAARDAICKPLNTQLIAVNAAGSSFHPDTTPSDLPKAVANLQQVIAIGEQEILALAALTPPDTLAADHATDVTHHRDSLTVLEQALAKLQTGKTAEANAISDATTPLSSLEEAFEAKYTLAGCP
jgi:hypothetical protein